MRSFLIIALAALVLSAGSVWAANGGGPIFDGYWFDPQEKGSNRPESNFGFSTDLAVRAEIIWHDGSAPEELLPAVSTIERQEIFQTKHTFRKRGTYRLKITLWAGDGKTTVVHVTVKYDGT